MKHLFNSLLFSMIIISAGFSVSPQGKIKEQKDNVLVVFNNKLTFEDLAQIKIDMTSKSISLDYLKLEFGGNGRLEFIKFKVDFKDGFKGAASKKLDSTNRFGFHRDYSENSPSPFTSGNLDN